MNTEFPNGIESFDECNKRIINEKDINKCFENLIKNINPKLATEEIKSKALEVKEKFNKEILGNILSESNNPFVPLLLILCGYPDVIDKAKDMLIKFFKDKTGVEATFEDIKLYNDIDSELGRYVYLKNYLENNKDCTDNIPPILTMFLNCKDIFITPLNDKISVLKDKQEYIINKYKNE